MGWANCGHDKKGRPIGYAHAATCDHPGCKAKIDRGLAYACGGMHGDGASFECEGYFCLEHLLSVTSDEMHMGQQCYACNARMLEWMRKCPEDFSAEELEDALGAESETPKHVTVDAP